MAVTVDRFPASRHAGERAEVSVILSDGVRRVIDCYGPDRAFGGQIRPATVSWSSLGSQSPDDAAAYASALCAAVAVARGLGGSVR